LGTGYNATFRGSDKSQIDMDNRDAKRPWMIHAEENAMLNCTKSPLDLRSTTIYVTGLPCVNCLQRIINFGISRVVMADRMGSITENEETQKMREKILNMSNIILFKMSCNSSFISKNFLDD
jgi:deoxycytidylate deaminase